MTEQCFQAFLKRPLPELFGAYPALRELFEMLQLPADPAYPLGAALSSVSPRWLRDKGTSSESLLLKVQEALEEPERLIRKKDREDRRREELLSSFQSLIICGGRDKDGRPEELRILLEKGDTVCVTGTTGSGKTRFLEDIEYLAAGDTPTGRTVLFNGRELLPEERMLLENRLSSYLSQSMNFILELSCRDFVFLHADCRGLENREDLLGKIMDCANRLAGEPFSADTPVTELSGGQSRAFMIADLVHISAAPVVLIDEPENAGIDKQEAIRLLAGSGKVVLISTHEPVLALSCSKRIVLKNGAVSEYLVRSPREEQLLFELRSADERISRIRRALRAGESLL